MVMKKKHRALAVFLNSLLVGRLEKMTAHNLMFTYDETWLKTPGARPISLSLPLVSQPFSGDVVYHFFDNLLPDNPKIKSRIQARFHLATDHPFDLLEMIGKDCVGAIQLLDHPIAHARHKNKIQCHPLTTREIAAILQDTEDAPLGMTESDDFRISIAGAQEKCAFLYWNGKWNRPIGSTPTTHIFKLPMGSLSHQHIDLSDSCENEWLCAQIAEAFGFPIAQSDIQHFSDTKALIVKRFDRMLSGDGKKILRLPQEDMCQALGTSPHLKYQADGGPGIKNVMRLLLGSSDPTNDRALFFSAQILFWLLAAIDGHAKNFSIFIEPDGKYRLTPLYDILSAHPLIANKQLQAKKIKMSMALKGKNNRYHWYDVKRSYFLNAAKDANFSVETAEAILDTILNKVEFVIETVSRSIPKNFPKKISRPIFDGILLTKAKLVR